MGRPRSTKLDLWQSSYKFFGYTEGRMDGRIVHKRIRNQWHMIITKYRRGRRHMLFIDVVSSI